MTLGIGGSTVAQELSRLEQALDYGRLSGYTAPSFLLMVR